jgi:hypothetical protein
VPAQDLQLAGDLIDASAEEVAGVRVPGYQPQGALLAAPADEDQWVRL